MISLKSAPAFGFESESCNASVARAMKANLNPRGNDGKIVYWAANFFKILGVVLPLVGAIRMIDALSSSDENSGMHFLRGLGELLGCGFFILGIDIAVTLYRASQQQEHDFILI